MGSRSIVRPTKVTGYWSIEPFSNILLASNTPPGIAQMQYSTRSPVTDATRRVECIASQGQRSARLFSAFERGNTRQVENADLRTGKIPHADCASRRDHIDPAAASRWGRSGTRRFVSTSSERETEEGGKEDARAGKVMISVRTLRNFASDSPFEVSMKRFLTILV